MARAKGKRAGDEPKKSPADGEAEQATPEGPRPIAIAVRGRTAWKEWADRLKDYASKKIGISLSLNALVGLALANYARSIGFEEEPPER